MSAISSKVYKGVRDWSVQAQTRDGITIQVKFKLGKYPAPDAVMDVSTWPKLAFDQQKRMLEAMKADIEQEGYAQQTRLADEACKAVNELIQTLQEKARVPEPWEQTRQEYQTARAWTVAGGVPILNARDGERHERLVRRAVLLGLPVPENVLSYYPHFRDPAYLQHYTHRLIYSDNGVQVGFEDETYSLMNAYIDQNSVRYGAAWFLYTTADKLLVPDPDNAKASIASRSLHEAMVMAEILAGHSHRLGRCSG